MMIDSSNINNTFSVESLVLGRLQGIIRFIWNCNWTRHVEG